MFNLHQHTRTGIPGTVVTNIQVPASSTVVVDSVSEQYNRSVKWVVTVVNQPASKIQAFEILAVNKFGVDVNYTKYSTVGDKINNTVDVVIMLGNIELQLTNNEITPLLINIVRMQSLS